MIKLLMAGIFAYLLGSMSFGIIIPRLLGTSRDIRQEGSGNAGATNVLRTQGKLQGALVLLTDLLKGALAAWIGLSLAGVAGGGVAGIFAMLGHCFPVFFGFKGGKGVATGAGVVLVLLPKALLIMIAAFILAILITRMVSLGSIAGAVTLLVCMLFFQPPVPIILFGVCAVALVLWKHESNIKRILAGTENKLGKKNK
ncbi:MAG: glycerol-3-phosphate 1-O-acyltransferase PlsY [Clostridiales bacterium]